MKNCKTMTLLLLCAALLAACGESDGETSNTTAADTPGTETTAELTDGLTGYDFDGRTFKIVYSADQLGSAWPYDVEEANGDILNDKVYARNAAVEERFNVVLEYYNVGGTGGEVPSAFRSSVLAADSDIQLAISHTFNQVAAMLSEGSLADFLNIPNIDLDKPWWNASIRDNLTIGGILPIAVSDLVYSYADVIFVNREMMENFKLDDTYDLVFEGRWTWGKLAEMAKAVAADLNGDGEYTDADQYGFVFPGETGSLSARVIHSNGMLLAKADDDGMPELITISERLQNTVERYYDLLYTGNQSYISKEKTAVQMFGEGSALFMHQTTLQLPSMRNVDVNFGIVPLPKYDEAQETYQSMLSSQILLIPNTTDDELEFIGTITEALSYESWKHVTPAVYESIFESKYLRDATSYEMYQQIRDSLVCDFNWNYGGSNDLTYMMLRMVIEQKSTDAASWLATCTPSIEEKFAVLTEEVAKIYGNNN